MLGQEGKRCADCLFWSLWQIYFHIFIMREIDTVIAFLWPMQQFFFHFGLEDMPDREGKRCADCLFLVSVANIFSYFHYEVNQYGDCLFMVYVTFFFIFIFSS